MNLRHALPLCLALAGCAVAPAGTDLDAQPAPQALPALTQRLLDALPHDAAVWERYLSPQALYVSEAGDVATRAELLEGFRPFPPGLSGSLSVQNPRVTEYGDFASIVFDAVERQKVFDQTIEVHYLGSQVWRREDGRWRLLLAHNGVRAQDPPAAAVSARLLRDYAGTYAAGEWRVQVEAKDGTLVAAAPGATPRQLIAVGDNVFAEAGNPLGLLRIFVRGRAGKVEGMIQRRKYADLVWKRVGVGVGSPKP